MLRKLIGTEFKSTLRTFLPLFGAILVLAWVNKIIDLSGSFAEERLSWIAGIAMATYGFIILATFAATLLIIIQRFYKNLLGPEGYLMNTLPLRTWKLLASKAIVAAIWVVLSILVTIGSIFILVWEPGFFGELWNYFWPNFWVYTKAIGENGVLILLLASLTAILSAFASLFMLYLSMAIGHLSPKNRIGASFGAFVGLYVGVQFLTSILVLSTSGWWNTLDTQMTLPLAVLATYELLLLGTYAFLTNQILKNRLNLE